MKLFVGLDVSLAKTAICVISEHGKIVKVTLKCGHPQFGWLSGSIRALSKFGPARPYIARSPAPMPSSSRNLTCQYRPPMHREDCCELGTSKLSDDIKDTSIIGSLTDQPAKIRCMKLPIGARCGPDLIVKLLRFGVSRLLQYRIC